jgi:hypothetical protein
MNSASPPNAIHQCHSIRESYVPASFFQDVFVTSENSHIRWVANLLFRLAAEETDELYE